MPDNVVGTQHGTHTRPLASRREFLPMRRLSHLLLSAALLASAVVAGAVSADAAEPADVLPTPQEVSSTGVDVDLSGALTVVAEDGVDAPARAALTELLTDVGATPTWAETAPDAGAVLHFGTSDASTQAVAAALGVDDASALEAEGYVVANGNVDGQPTVLLEGTDGSGLFYAVQTLRQLVDDDGTMSAATIRDWPLMSIRGGIEGFYGIPWSHQARLDQFEFYGKHKMNTYVYTPKDDSYLRMDWRELYPAAELDKLTELVSAAKDNHVEFVFALSPGNDLCHADPADFDATIAKFEQLRGIGVTSFYVALDDIDPYLKCDLDLETFTAGGFLKLADAQAHYLNRIVDEFINVHDLKPLQTVPTNYFGSAPDPYTARFGLNVDDSVRIQWTGEGVFSDTITVDSVVRAKSSYNTDHLYIWDNFPVNDGQTGRLFLNPLTGRDAALHEHLDGFTSNPMVQSYASMIALAGYGDYTWNSPAYDAQVTLAAIIDELAGPDPEVREALEVFVDLNQDWRPYRPTSPQAPAFAADVAAFWTALESGDEDGMAALRERLEIIQDLPETLAPMAMAGFHDDSLPWLEAAVVWADGVTGAMDAMIALADDDHATAAEGILTAVAKRTEALTTASVAGLVNNVPTPGQIVPSVGDGRFDEFLQRAFEEFEDSLGGEAAATGTALPATASRSNRLGQWSNNAISNMTDGNLNTLWWSDGAPNTNDWIQLDLGSVTEVGSVVIHQADNDTTAGDMFYNAALEYSTDGTIWTEANRFTNTIVVQHTFAEPVDARYVRLRATAPNPGAQWIKIREFMATGPIVGYGTDIDVTQGSAASLAFDLDVHSALLGTAADGDVVTRQLSSPQTGGSVIVLGTAAGVVEVETDDGWVGVGTTTADDVWHHFGVADDVTFGAVRIVLDAGAVDLTELVVSTLVVDAGPDPTTSPDPTEDPDPTSSPDPTEEPTPTPTTTVTVTATASTTATATASTTVTATASTTATQTVVTTVTPTVTIRPTETVTAEPTWPGPTVNPGAHLDYPQKVYQVPGLHSYNGRQWSTTCEPYSSTTRCTTDIWATTVVVEDGEFVQRTGWAFNNLTYLPSDRAIWADNPLGGHGEVGFEGEWTSSGRQWRTECDTAATGNGACRSYIWATVVDADPPAGFRMTDKWVFNNIVLFD